MSISLNVTATVKIPLRGSDFEGFLELKNIGSLHIRSFIDYDILRIAYVIEDELYKIDYTTGDNFTHISLSKDLAVYCDLDYLHVTGTGILTIEKEEEIAEVTERCVINSTASCIFDAPDEVLSISFDLYNRRRAYYLENFGTVEDLKFVENSLAKSNYDLLSDDEDAIQIFHEQLAQICQAVK